MAGLGWGPKDNTTKAERDAAKARAEEQMAAQRGDSADSADSADEAPRHRRARRPR
jgi:hypothetical protein